MEGASWTLDGPYSDTNFSYVFGAPDEPDRLWVIGGRSGTYTILSSTDGGDSWTYQTAPAGTTDLYGMYFIDSYTGWIVGSVGGEDQILHTTNGGDTWTAQPTTATDQPLNDVYALDASTAWVVGHGGTIIKTTDGGATWNSQNSGTTSGAELRIFFRFQSWMGFRRTGRGDPLYG